MTTARSITSEQRIQYKRFVEDGGRKALRQASLDKESLQRLFKRGGEFQAHILEGIQRFSAKQPDYTLAQSVLGTDFITPEEIAKARGVVYSPEQIESLGNTIPPEDTLRWCRDNGFMLVAGPPRPMSLLEIRDLKNEYLYSKTGGWYSNDKEKFSRDDKATTKWLKLRKGPVPNSTSKNWSEQQSLLSEVEYVPNAAEATWGVTSYKAVRGVYLLPNVYVRTSSLVSDGNRVYVGFFDAEGLRVHLHWDDYRDDFIGLASARK